MSLQQHRVLIVVATGILALIVASPALSRLLVYPRTKFFTEFWFSDADNTARNYPYNITGNQNYSIYLGIGNRLGYCAYYLIMVKFRNESQPGPTSFGAEGTRLPSNVSSLFNLPVFVGDLQAWEKSVTFSFDYTYDDIAERVDFNSIKFNDALLDMSGYTVARSADAIEYRGYLFFELWLYHNVTRGFIYHERYVSLRLNMTA